MAISRRKFLEVSALSTTGIASSNFAYSLGHPEKTAAPIAVDTQSLSVSVDAASCRWSAQVKGTAMQLNDVYFLPGDDASGWKVTSAVNKTDENKFGSFVTVTLHGTKPGQLDFDYQISVSKTGNDILVSLGRTNNTGKAVDVQDMDYFVSTDARLGGTTDRWRSLGTHYRNRDEYDLDWVEPIVTPKMYAVNHVVRDADSGNSLLIGHVTTLKGASRFEIRQGWEGKTPDRMQVRGYCNYKVTMPSGKSFDGEKLLVCLNTDALRAMEHQGDLISLAHDIRLKERRPINLDDREWVANDYSRFHSYQSGGNNANAEKFFKEHGLEDFYWGMGGPTAQGHFGFYGSGGGRDGRPGQNNNYPAECYLPIHTPKYGGERVIDFSNPLTIKLEHERAFKWASDNPHETGRTEMDFADWWDKWPGQFDPYMSALETYHAGGMPWRDAIDQIATRRVVRSNMEPVDHSYGIVDICRISEDADQGYESLPSGLLQIEFSGRLTESVMGLANRFFYNGRVFWNDGDGFHIYKYNSSDGKLFDYGQGKVDANFHAIAGSTLFVEEAFDVPYPEDRVELLKRISPPTMDVSYPVDLFVRKPAQVYNMPVERPFAKWNVVAVFNYTAPVISTAGMKIVDEGRFQAQLDAAKDLRLDPDKEYLVYEFWSKTFLGSFKGRFTSRKIVPYDCDVYAIVEKQDRPVLLSTSRHVRSMAFDIKDMSYDRGQRVLSGVSRAVAGDPYQLRIYVPDGFKAQRVELSDGLSATMTVDGNLLMADYIAKTGNDVSWRVHF